jgi:hypothetical protein
MSRRSPRPPGKNKRGAAGDDRRKDEDDSKLIALARAIIAFNIKQEQEDRAIRGLCNPTEWRRIRKKWHQPIENDKGDREWRDALISMAKAEAEAEAERRWVDLSRMLESLERAGHLTRVDKIEIPEPSE